MQRDLVERAIGGDSDAFADLARASLSSQYALATLILRDRDRAQDAVQEALVSAWRGLSALRDPDAWEAWLRRLTVRACFHQVRRDRKRRLVEVPGLPRTMSTSVDDPSVAIAERDRVDTMLARLPLEQRAVIVLHYHLGLPLSEAAPILEIPVGTASSRLHRGLAALRGAMDAEPEVTNTMASERGS